MKKIGELIRQAQNADPDELWNMVRSRQPEVIDEAVLNRHFNEEMAVFIAKGKYAGAATLGFLAGDVRFKGSHKLKVALCNNPKTPQRIIFSLLKFLRLFELAALTRNKKLPLTIRQKVEYIIFEQLPSMALGIKKALVRRADSAVILRLLEKGDEIIGSVCLDSPLLTEPHICTVLNKCTLKPEVVRLIADHPKWSLRYTIQYALIRNNHTPLSRVNAFIGGMRTSDLRDLYADTKVPQSTKHFIYGELSARNESIDIINDEVYDLTDDDADQG